MKYLPTSHGFREEWRYNNFMYLQLGYIAEVLGGAPYEQLIQEKIFDRLGMRNATFFYKLDEVDNRAKPHELDVDGTLVPSDERAYRYVQVCGLVLLELSFLCHLLCPASVCPSVCLSGSHSFFVVTHSYVSHATHHAFLGMLLQTITLIRSTYVLRKWIKYSIYWYKSFDLTLS